MYYLQKLVAEIVVLPTLHAIVRKELAQNMPLRIDPRDQPEMAQIDGAKNLCITLLGLLGGVSLGDVGLFHLTPGSKTETGEAEPESKNRHFYDRYFLILQAPPGCTVTCGDETMSVKSGELWWIHNAQSNEMKNNSSDDLLWLSIDIRIDR